MSITSGLKSHIHNLFEHFTYLPLTQDNFSHALRTTVHRRMIALSQDPHPSSAPYLSGDSFAKLATHVINDRHAFFSPQAVQQGDVVFVNVQLLSYFFRVIHPHITNQYVLITHNGDTHIDRPQLQYLDDKIIHWYAQNVVIKHPKITPIPIGLENLFLYNHGVPKYIEQAQAKKKRKQTNILMEFSVSTNPVVRGPLWQLGKQSPVVYTMEERLSAPAYFDTLSGFEFVLSPPGNGLDCHRTWEAMCLGVIPIVEKSVTTQSFQKLGLPIWVVNDFKQVIGLNQKQLHTKYLEITKQGSTEPLNIVFWEKMIKGQNNR